MHEATHHRGPKPTLLVFTLGADAESRRRPLLPQRLASEERAFRSACLDAALAAGREAGCRLEVSSPATRRDAALPALAGITWRPQTGDGFGTRLAGALDRCFAEAPGPVALVGTDVPGLTAGHVTRALAELAGDPDRVVLGPSPDGGFYLLAAARPIDGLADDVRWCSAATLTTLRAALEAAGRPVTLLAPLADLDAPGDLERWIKTARRPAVAASPVVRTLRAWAARLGRLLDELKRLLPRLVPTPPPAPAPVTVPVRGPPRRRPARPARGPVRSR